MTVNQLAYEDAQPERARDAGALPEVDRVRIIYVMIQGAIGRIVAARGHINRCEIGAKGEQISRAFQLITSLRVCLEGIVDPDVARDSSSLCEYMLQQLLAANLHDDIAALDEVSGMLRELADGWSEVMRSVGDRQAAAWG